MEAGFEKIAFYAAPDDTPTHVARQLPNGRWTSKLGSWEDIEHATERDVEGIGAFRYGEARRFMRKPRAT